MKKAFSILALGVAPALALTAGQHAWGHGTPEHGHSASAVAGAPSSVGQPGDPANTTRTIELTMDDTMRFTPSEIQVKAGETVRFSVKNAGKIPHEMVIGSLAELQAHAAEMRKTPQMQHAEPNMVALDAGQAGSLVWQFGQAGAVDFACLIPGHMEAGMVGKIRVD